MENVHNSVAWYQQKIGSYDKQLWEQSVEQKVLQDIKLAPRRSVRPKNDLIDVDLVRGSTFTKTKLQVAWTAITLTTISRVLFFPLHYKWWIQQMSITFWTVLLVLYCLQIFITIMFFRNVGDSIAQDEQTLTAVMIPAILMVFLGLIHSQTVLTHVSQKSIRDNKRDFWRRKRSLSQQRNSGGDSPPSPSVSSELHSSPVHSSSKVTHFKTSRKENQSGSRSLKTQSSSRSGRDRTKDRSKDRKQRVKSCASQRSPAAVARKVGGSSQDSESAYISHEASDSVADRASSHEQDTNNFTLSDKQESTASAQVDHLKVFDYKNLKKDDESPESDLSESHDEKNLSNTEPQESSSDEESIQCKVERMTSSSPVLDNSGVAIGNGIIRGNSDVVNGENMVTESNNVTAENQTQIVSKVTKVPGTDLEGQNVAECSITPSDSATLCNKIPMNNGTVASGVHKKNGSGFLEEAAVAMATTTPVMPGSDSKQEMTESSVPEVTSIQASQSGSLSSDHSSDHKVVDRKSSRTSSNGNETLSAPTVGFQTGSDLIKFKLITPLGSRESSPTHVQSETALHTKSNLRFNLTTPSESDSDTGVKGYQSLSNIRRRKVTITDLGAGSDGSVRPRRSLLLSEKRKSKTLSSSGGETETTNQDYSRHTVSSEEWDDRIQSEVTTSSFNTSCSSDIETSAPDDLEGVPDKDTSQQTVGSSSTAGMAPSHINIINLLQPSTSQSNAHGPVDKVTCIIWEGNECKKVELTAMDIGWAIINKVNKIPESSDYIMIGLTFSLIICFTPCVFHLFHAKDFPDLMGWDALLHVCRLIQASTWKQNLITINAMIQRLALSAIFFFLLSVADRTFRQRLLYAKYFCYLTSSRRSRKFDMPHFRLNKVRNIKTWLSLRSYLKKRGPQRSVDVIVSSSFLVTLIMLILVCLQLLRDTETYLDYMCNWELLVWCLMVGVYLLRFMTLGLRINKKYGNLSVLITEQINLYLQMDQKPHKKEELMVANNVLKLAETLLKELESPFKISGISANPFILNVTKVVVLSAFSAVLTELLGFKLKLYKIKLKA